MFLLSRGSQHVLQTQIDPRNVFTWFKKRKSANRTLPR